MRFNKSLVAFVCLIGSLLLMVQAQETTPETSTTTLELDESNQTPAPFRPNSTNGIFRLFYHPLRKGINHARKFINKRVENLQNGLDQARLQTYKMFMRIYNKTYSPEELPRRMALFFKRRDEIQQSVKAFMEGKSLFAMKENAFTDWDDDELKKLTGVSLPSKEQLEEEEHRVSRYARSVESDEYNLNMTVRAEIPVSKNWTAEGCDAAPSHQKDCGACYAFAIMSIIESMRCIKGGMSPVLSAQQIVDCASRKYGYGTSGCKGGWPSNVFSYLQKVGVSATEECYPYANREQSCQLENVKAKEGCVVSPSPTKYEDIEYKLLRNENDILLHVARTGPVVTLLKVVDRFYFYSRGIYDDHPSCSNGEADVNHAVVITGYGRENGIDYWLVKNSWGTTWGMNGYAKYARGKSVCSFGTWGWVITN